MAAPRGRRPAPQKDTTRTNEDITAREVRLIDHEGEQRGVLNTRKALEIAEEAGLDLVEISPNAEPPVAKIMDYGKYKFEQSKKQAEAKKKQHKTQVKELKFRPGTDIGDYNIKFKKLTEFIEKGDKVKCTVRFRGREMAHKELGLDVLQRIEEDAKEIAQIEQRPSLEGRQMVMVIAPLKKK